MFLYLYLVINFMFTLSFSLIIPFKENNFIVNNLLNILINYIFKQYLNFIKKSNIILILN